MPLNYPHCYGLSDVGQVRENNEDQLLIADLSKLMTVHQSTLPLKDETRLFSDVQGQLLLVADGMGGHAAGERASELATSTIASHVLHTMPWFLRLQHEDNDHLHELLEQAVRQCARAVESEAAVVASERDMGTTLTMAYIIWPRMFVVHVGDSRCYLLRQGKLEQITRDHTFLNELERRGQQVCEKKRSRYGCLLMNSIGRGLDQLRPEVYQVDLQLNDAVMLCTDGLSDMLSDEQISTIMRCHYGDEKATCEALIAEANRSGGRDNVTVIASRFMRGDDAFFSEDEQDDTPDTVLEPDNSTDLLL